MPSQTQSLVINGNEFDCNNHIEYSKPKMNTRGGKNVPIKNVNSKKQLYLSTPLMMTWGARQNDFNNDGKYTYDMSLQFPRESDANYNEKTAAFLDNMKQFETKLLEDAYNHRKDWFGKANMSKDVLQALFSPMLKYPKGEDGEPDHTRSPNLNVKLPYYDGEFKCELYDSEENQIFPNDEADQSNEELILKLIQKTQNVAVLIECGGIWFASGKFGVTWRLTQAVVKPLISLKGRCHIQLDDEDKANLNNQTTESSEQAVTETVDSDEDEEDEKPVEEVAVKKVKRSRKKAA